MEADVIFEESNCEFCVSFDENMTLMGPAGKSAYQIACDNGFKGTELQWLMSLKGADGTRGRDGRDGHTPIKGVDYYTPAEKQAFSDEIFASLKIDNELSEDSTNAIQNRAVAVKFADVETTIGNIDVLLGNI